MTRKTRLVEAILVAWGIIAAFDCWPQVTSLSNFNSIQPEVFADWGKSSNDPSMRQIQSHIESLYIAAKRLAGDGAETEAFQACEEIVANRENVPFEIYRWAFLHRILLHAVCSREDLAIQVARDWELRHPIDPVMVKMKCVILQIVGWRGSDHFTPTLTDLRFAEAGLFDDPTPDIEDADVLDAYRVDAQALERLYRLTGEIGLLHEAIDRLNEAEIFYDVALEVDHIVDSRISREYLEANAAHVRRLRSELEAMIVAETEDITIDLIQPILNSLTEDN